MVHFGSYPYVLVEIQLKGYAGGPFSSTLNV